MTAPSLPVLLILTFGSYRLWRLAALDSILNRPRDRVVATRPRLDSFVACPWCLGFWIAAACTVAWWVWPAVTVAVLLPFAVSSAVGEIGGRTEY